MGLALAGPGWPWLGWFIKLNFHWTIHTKQRQMNGTQYAKGSRFKPHIVNRRHPYHIEQIDNSLLISYPAVLLCYSITWIIKPGLSNQERLFYWRNITHASGRSSQKELSTVARLHTVCLKTLQILFYGSLLKAEYVFANPALTDPHLQQKDWLRIYEPN